MSDPLYNASRGHISSYDPTAEADARSLVHCHRCGSCVCTWHTAYSDDNFDEVRRLCAPCLSGTPEEPTP